jgi:hypothetical protein
MQDTAILILIFNRPDYTRQLVDALRGTRPARVYVAADGPRPGRNEHALCESARKVIDSIDWECRVEKLYRDNNLGCGKAVSEAITWFFSKEEEGIILEDDCIPHQSFFTFASHLLERYRHDSRVMMVSGTSYIYEDIVSRTPWYFCRYYSVWGWATWRRAWELYDHSMSDWPAKKSGGYLDYILPDPRMARVYEGMFDDVTAGRVDTWDLQWVYSCLVNNGLCATSAVNLVRNIGADGTHTGAGHAAPWMRMPPVKSWHLPSPEPEKKVAIDSQFEKLAFTTLLEKFFGTPAEKRPMAALRLVKGLVRRVRRAITPVAVKEETITLPPSGPSNGKNALLSYIRGSVLAKDGSQALSGPSNRWESREIATLLAERGFSVDVIEWNDDRFVPRKEYHVIIDIAFNLQRLAAYVPSGCVRLLHCTGSYWYFANQAELGRVRDLEMRKGGVYSPRRLALYPELQERSLEMAHACSLIGNQVTKETYPQKHHHKIVCIPVSTSVLGFSKSRENYSGGRDFLWFNSFGMVHKGLDLLIEIFAVNPGWQLHVAGHVDEDLRRIYSKELTLATNIHFYGMVDPSGPKFREILLRCFCFISPSCSEGMSGASATCLQSGLYPIISRNSGIDLPLGAGIMLERCTIDEITAAIHQALQLKGEELERQISMTKEYALGFFSRENFSAAFSVFLDSALQKLN